MAAPLGSGCEIDDWFRRLTAVLIKVVLKSENPYTYPQSVTY